MDVHGPIVAILVAISICALNTLGGYAVARMAFGKDLNAFLALIFGSLGFRSMAVLASAWFFLSVMEVHRVSFALTFAVVSFVLLIGEIFYFHRSFERQKREMRPRATELMKKKVSDMIMCFCGTTEHCIA